MAPLSYGNIQYDVDRGIYTDTRSGGFGSTQSPDLSNDYKKQRYQQFLNREGEFASVPLTQEQQQQKRADLLTSQKTEEQDFLGRFKTEFPTVLSGIEQDLNLPGLRETAFTSSEQLRTAPERTEKAALGFDVSANQLARQQASETARLAPIAQTAVQQAQFGEEEFGRRAQREMVPYQTEIDMMKDRFARETTGFNLDSENELNLLLAKMQQSGQLQIAEMQRATQLAQIEAQTKDIASNLSPIDLGNRIALINPATGQEISSFSKGLTPSRGVGTLADGW